MKELDTCQIHIGILPPCDAIYMRHIIGLREWIAYGAFVYSNFNLNGMYSLYDNGWLDSPVILATYTRDAIYTTLNGAQNACYRVYGDTYIWYHQYGINHIMAHYWLNDRTHAIATNMQFIYNGDMYIVMLLEFIQCFGII